MVPMFGLIRDGQGRQLAGAAGQLHLHSQKEFGLGRRSPTDPRRELAGIFTGLILLNTFYWVLQIGMLQHRFTIKLAEGQGALLTAGAENAQPASVLVPAGVGAFSSIWDLPESRARSSPTPAAGQPRFCTRCHWWVSSRGLRWVRDQCLQRLSDQAPVRY